MTDIAVFAGQAIDEWRPAWQQLLAVAGLPADDIGEVERAWKAGRGDELIAAAGVQCQGEHRLLRSMVVASNHRRAGWGARLLASIESALRQDGVQAVWLLTTDGADYFRRHGYVARPRTEAPAAVASTSQFRGLCPATAVLMVKRLG
jgi:N-acetylglutamate synthase-like GNAT family acetyltransferase